MQNNEANKVVASAVTLQEAKRKARYGHRDWIGYCDKSGAWHHVLLTVDSLKAAMVEHGDKEPMELICKSDGCLMVMPPWMQRNVLAQLERGMR